MTGAGIALYLVYLGSYAMAIVTAVAFAPLIGFHFAITRLYDRKEKIMPHESRRLIKIRRL